MLAYGGGAVGGKASNHSSTRHSREATGQFHAPSAFHPEEQLPVPAEWEAGWASEPVYTFRSLVSAANQTAIYHISYLWILIIFVPLNLRVK